MPEKTLRINSRLDYVFAPSAVSPLHMRDCVISMPIAMGLQKNSPLKPSVDRFLQRVIEAGLVKKWLNDVMSTVRSPVKTESKALMDLRKMYLALVALAVGYVLGCLALGAELLHWKYVVQREPHFDLYKKPVRVDWGHYK